MKDESKNSRYLITIPSYRPDLQNKEDLVEEVIKIYGYKNITNSLPALSNTSLSIDKRWNWKDLFRQYLINHGCQEIITYSLISAQKKKHFCFQDTDDTFYRLLVPKNENYVFYRHSLFSSHLETIKYNLSHKNQNLFFFEISKVYYQNLSKIEEEVLALSSTGKLIDDPLHKLEAEWDYFWLKGIIEGLFKNLSINEGVEFVPAKANEFHPYQNAEISLEGKKLGLLGKISSETTNEYGINQPVFTAQISLTNLFAYLFQNDKWNYQIVSLFPSTERDLSFFLDKDISVAEVTKTIQRTGGKFLKEIRLFDIYEDEKHKTQRSLTFRITFQSSDKTLLSKEVDEVIQNIITIIQRSFKVQIRE